jgi:hypothetical protein
MNKVCLEIDLQLTVDHFISRLRNKASHLSNKASHLSIISSPLILF